MTDTDRTRRRQPAFKIAALVIMALAAVAFIVIPNLPHQNRSGALRLVRPETSTIDPQALVPAVADLPSGSLLQSGSYITNVQASQRNQTSLSFLRGAGREVGFDRDFLIPRYGDIEVEVVRFKSHAGMGKAYDYFLGLPHLLGLTARPFRGLGEHAALVTSPQAGFVEFMRGRYYVVVTTVPATQSALGYIHTLARRVDSRILHYGPSA